MNIYSLLDLKLKEYGPLVLANNDEAVKRALKDGVPGSQSLMAKYPADFALMSVGVFDMDTGVIVPEETPRLVDSLDTILPKGEVSDA